MLPQTEARKNEFFEIMRELERRKGIKDLYYLANAIVGYYWFMQGESRMDWHHQELSSQLSALWSSRKQRIKTQMYVEWCRGTLKSTVCTQAFPIWVILNDPNVRILIDSDVGGNAKQFLINIKTTIESEFFRWVYGKLFTPGDRWSTEELTVHRSQGFKEPTIDYGGIDKEKTGMHYDLIIADDLQAKTNCNTPEQIDKVIKHARLYGSLLNPSGMVLFGGTRWGLQDLGAWIHKQNQIAIKALRPIPFHISSYRDYKVIDGKVSEEPEFPTLLPQQKLAEERAQQGEALYGCNYRLEPTNDESSWFKKDWFRYHDLSYHEVTDGNFYISVDPCKFDSKQTVYRDKDYTAIVVACIDSKYNIYVMECIRERMTESRLIERLFELNDRYKPIAIGMETVFWQKALYFKIKEIADKEGLALPMREYKGSNKQKALRIRGLSPVLESGHFWFRPEMLWLEYELFNYSGEGSIEHDDCIDASAYLLEFIEAARPEKNKVFWERDPAWAKNWKPEDGKKPDVNDVGWLRAEKEQNLKMARLKGRGEFVPLSSVQRQHAYR